MLAHPTQTHTDAHRESAGVLFEGKEVASGEVGGEKS